MAARKPKKTRPKTKAKTKPTKKPLARKPNAPKPVPVKINWIAWAIILALSFGLYSSSLPYEFVLDDKLVLSENNFVKNGLSGIGDLFANESFTGFFGEQKDLVAGARYRPMSLVTYALEVEFFGVNPKVHRFVNILLYGLTGIAIFQFICLLFPGRKEDNWVFSLAFLTAIIFIAHPVHVEAVANIKGRDEVMALLFSVLTFNAILRYINSSKILWLAAAIASFFVAMMSKENSIAFLGVIPLGLFLFRGTSLKQMATMIAPLVAIAGVYILIRYQVIGYFLDSGKEQSRLLINNPFLDMNGMEKYATIFYTLLLDLKLLFFPHPLTSDYNPYHIPIMNWGDWRVLLSLLVYIGMGVFVLLRYRKNQLVVFCILYFIFTIFLVSNLLFPVGSFMNERFLFMPSLAGCIILAWVISDLFPKQLKMELVGYGLLALVMTGFIAKTITRLPDWKNSFTLTTSAVKVSKNSARANSFYAYSLYRSALEITDQAQQKAMFDEALPYAEKAISIYPDYADALTAKAGILTGYYKMDGQLQPVLDGFYSILEEKQINYVKQYLEYLNGRNVGQQLIEFYYKTGYELYVLQKQEYNNAIEFLNYGRQLAPGDLRFVSGLAAAYYYSGNYGKCLEFGLNALQGQPDDAFSNYFVGLANQQLGNTSEAELYLNRAYAADPSLRNQ